MNSESNVSANNPPQRIDFLSGLAKDGFDVGEMEKTLSDKWVKVTYKVKDPKNLGIEDDVSLTVEFEAKRGLDSAKKDEHTLITNVIMYDDANEYEPENVKRVKQADLGPIRRDEVEPHPARKYPRNWPCFCGSGKKFKKCHLEQVPHWILKNEAPRVKAMIDAFKENFAGRTDAINETADKLKQSGEIH